MTSKPSFISVDEHVQEHPEVWTKRLSRQKWGARMPHIVKTADGNERWLIDGREIALDGVADCGAVMAERTPLAEMFGYSTVLRSLTQGQAQFTMEFLAYRQMPQSSAEELEKKAAEHKKKVA